MHRFVHLVWRRFLPLLLLFGLLATVSIPAARANDEPSLAVSQALFTRDTSANEATQLDELVPGIRAELRTTVTNLTDAPIFVKISWQEATFGARTATEQDPDEDQVLRLTSGESRSFARPVPPMPLMEPTFQATLVDQVLSSTVTACVLANPNAVEDPCPDPELAPATSVRHVLNIPLRMNDLGDAPDSTNHAGVPMLAYPTIQANFPTVFAPATGTPSGPLHVDPRPFHLGPRVSLEAEADLGPDQDPRNNLVPSANRPDNDRADDGIRLDPATLKHCEPARVGALVFVTPAFKAAALEAGVTQGYLNIWLDGNRDGDWADAVECPEGSSAAVAVEHILIDAPIDLASLNPGLNPLTFMTGAVPWPDALQERPAWLRATLSLEPSSKPLTVGDVRYGDGRGLEDAQGNALRFRHGETEDYLINRRGAATQPELQVRKVGRVVFDADLGERIAVWLIEYRNTGSAVAENVVITDAITGLNINELLIDVQSNPEVEPTAEENRLSFAVGKLDPDTGGRIVVRTRLPATTGRAALINTVTMRADATSNSNASATIRIGLPAPIIVAPGSGVTCNAEVTVRGLATPGAEVRLFNASGATVGSPTTAGPNGRWQIAVTLNQGRNQLYAQARLGEQTSPRSAPLAIFVNPNLPFDPLSMVFSEEGTNTRTRPEDRRGITSPDGWFVHLRPNTTYTFSVRSCCDDAEAALTLQIRGLDPIVLTDATGNGIYTGTFTTGDLAEDVAFRLTVVCGAQNTESSGLLTSFEDVQILDGRTDTPIVTATVTFYRMTTDGFSDVPLDYQDDEFQNPINPDANGRFGFTVNPRSLLVRVQADGFQPVIIRSSNALGNFEIQDLLSVPRVAPSGEPEDGLGTITPAIHWREPLTATLRLSPSFGGGGRYRQIIGSGGFEGSSLNIQPGSVVEFVNSDIWENELLVPRQPEGSPDPRPRVAPQHGDHDHDHAQGALFTTGLIAPGGSFFATFDEPGVYTISDAENGFNTLTVLVEASAPPPGGRFQVFLPVLQR
ncbi:hypothetical protein EYB53_006350 [Candidatus Chloroploca sp. M-50]|uniref:DUF11 domain-containing protein n=1 Tax=Candidatus Chloroploca mongolica TaxID=2528176 RepID=A0ABS4D7A5_9CHLR|nr:hypothetical protein [Candidatus Chloroploca mongolica]MBP1465321.1 hypothetical protein [Candidatus Chloroploca mongolica]